jgi:hypothetical protein
LSSIHISRQLWQLSGQTDINIEAIIRTFRWIGHTLRKDDEQRFSGILMEIEEGGDEGTAGGDQQ